ncbi:phosphopantetheine-binding protein [Streptomyces koelreuteriae]|uniref:phosphopantetheine-binding protein n=1 Tax=Streptomyces koelreuteriae TaxID=2838015 RepID=UPI003EBC4E56
MRTAAVVVLRDDPTDAATATMDAYVVLSPGADPTTIRERDAGVLPDYMLPATDDLTMTLTEIWSDVLGVPVGPDDDLFELGGNSLFAVRITAAQRTRGVTPLRMWELYRHPTIRESVGILRSLDG